MTYRQLLRAIERANELEREALDALGAITRGMTKRERHNMAPAQRDAMIEREEKYFSHNASLDQEIDWDSL